jgi:hypothetical protein
VGSTLTRCEIQNIIIPELSTETASVVFESLVRFAKGLEVFRFVTEGTAELRKDDLQVLASPGCLPHLRELELGSFEAEEKKADQAHPCEKAAVAVLKSHQSTLEHISIHGRDLLLGNPFVQACLRMDRLRSFEYLEFSPKTSLTLFESLYHKHVQLGCRLLQAAVGRLGSRDPCSACLLINGDVDTTHEVYQCPEAAGINLTRTERQEWYEAEVHGYCSRCFLPISLHGREQHRSSRYCNWETTTEPLIGLLAAQNPAWNVVGEDGEPAYWRPILRALCRIRRDSLLQCH